MELVGQINFDGHTLEVYNSLDEPYFLANDISKLLDYSIGKTGQMLAALEKDEYLTDIQYRSGQKRHMYMVTELGFYNILSQSRKPIGRKWRRIIHSNLIMMRRQNKLTITGQFEEWDAMLDTIFIDEETGQLMEFITLPGGDVEIKPYEEDN